MNVSLTLPPELLAELASAVADELERRGTLTAKPTSPYLSTDEAAEHLRCSRQRIHDLTSAGALRPARDGRRCLYRREDLDALVRGDAA